ncbi:MAG: metalloregulator ArsR/SmtB family transcription factor [Polyangiaceae bacterium]
MQGPSPDWITRFRALGDETRLGLLCALLTEELSVGELSEVMQAAQPGISRHLAALRDAGLVVARKQGTTTYYRISPDDPLLEGAVGSELRRRSAELGLTARIERVVARRRAKAEAFFDEQAESWDNLREQLLDQAAGLRTLVPLIPAGLTVADIGTGTGGMLPLLSEFAEKIVAVDISQEMLRRAKARAKTLGLENVDFIKADLRDLPLEDESVDAAFATLVLHHAPHPAAAVKEMARVLRPGRVLIVVDLYAHRHEWLREEQGDVWLGFTKDEMIGFLNKAGLSRIDFKIVSHVETDKKGGGHPLKLFVASGVVPSRK